MPLVSARGSAFHVQELGTATASRSTPLVMLHGLLVGSLASWYLTSAPALSQKRRVFLYDLRGHGLSERTPTGYDLASMSADLAALIARFDGPVDLVGHSYGALVALRFALDNPHRVRRLALVEAPLPLSDYSEIDEFVGRSPGEMVEALPEALKAMVASGGRRAVRFAASIQFLVSECSLLADLRAEPEITDADLARVDLPVLCVYGDGSRCRPVGDRLVAALPHARLAVLSGGHFLHLDATAALTSALAEFLDE